MALVNGNSDYAEGALSNPVNDARDMRAALLKVGFAAADIVYRENLRRDAIGPVLREFKARLRGSPTAVALVFYAGHGVQSRGENYFPAVDARIGGEEDVPLQSLHLRQVLDLLAESKARVNLLFLDACRNNPYRRSARDGARGLGRVDAGLPSGTLIAYATRANAVAADGKGRNGLFTAALLTHMAAPGDTVEQVLKRVVRQVRTASDGQQIPWSEGSLEGDFYFVDPGQRARAPDLPAASSADPPPVATAAEQDRERARWSDWQSRMRADYAEAQALQGNRDAKARRWSQFLATWTEQNPTTNEDDDLRARARSSLAELTRAAAPAQPVSSGAGDEVAGQVRALQASIAGMVAVAAAFGIVLGLRRWLIPRDEGVRGGIAGLIEFLATVGPRAGPVPSAVGFKGSEPLLLALMLALAAAMPGLLGLRLGAWAEALAGAYFGPMLDWMVTVALQTVVFVLVSLSFSTARLYARQLPAEVWTRMVWRATTQDFVRTWSFVTLIIAIVAFVTVISSGALPGAIQIVAGTVGAGIASGLTYLATTRAVAPVWFRGASPRAAMLLAVSVLVVAAGIVIAGLARSVPATRTSQPASWFLEPTSSSRASHRV